MTKTIVTAKCVACGHEQDIQDIRGGEVPRGELPTCEKCMSPMYVKKARRDG